MKEAIQIKCHWYVRKYQAGEQEPYEVCDLGENLLLNEGINAMLKLLIGSATSPDDYGEANAYIGVGDGTAAAAAAQTDLQGANKAYKGMDTDYPADPTGQSIIFRSTFIDSEAEFAWEEFTVANGSSGAATNLNRKVQACGTKGAGLEWAVEVVLEIT